MANQINVGKELILIRVLPCHLAECCVGTTLEISRFNFSFKKTPSVHGLHSQAFVVTRLDTQIDLE